MHPTLVPELFLIRHFLLLLLVLFLTPTPTPTPTTALGINYGRVADNLLSPPAVVPLLRSLSITNVKLFDADPEILRAFSNTSFSFTVGVPDNLVPGISNSTDAAFSFISDSLLLHPSTPISSITVGNEVLTNNPFDSHSLLPAMLSLHSAISSLSLNRHVSVTTPHSLAILSSPSFPPSSATFRHDLLPQLRPLLHFLHRTNSPFLVNAYPYFAYKADPHSVDLNYTLFEPNSGVLDPETGLLYCNMLHAQVDAVHSAIAAAVGEEKGREIEVQVSETGWPSMGDDDEVGATVQNARRYNGNLIRMVGEGKGTPMRPKKALEVYLFALFNEDLKPGPLSERNYGLFQPDGTPVYDLGIGSDGNSSEAEGDENSTGAPVLQLPANTYGGVGSLEISAAVEVEWCSRLRRGVLVVMSWILALGWWWG